MSLTQAQYIAVKRGLTHLFRMGEATAKPFYPKVCTRRKSDGEDELYAKMGSMPTVREFVGERIFKELTAADWTLANKLWELSIGLEKTKFEDDRVGMFSDVLQELGTQMQYHPDKLRLQLQIDGETGECWDGQAFYDTDHEWRKSGSQSNIVVVQVVDKDNMTPAEFKGGIETAVDRMLGLKKDNGDPFVQPVVGQLNDLLIETPLKHRTVAHNAYGQAFKLEGGAATTNVIIDTPEIAVAPQLGTSGGLGGNDDHCYLHYTGSRHKPYIYQPRWAKSKTSMKGMDDDEVKDLKFMGTNRLNMGYFMWMFSMKIKFENA